MSDGAMTVEVFQKDDALLEEIARCDRYDDDFRLWWLGQSGFLLQYKQRHVLFDPYLSDSLTEKYANTDKPHTRMSERVIDPASSGLSTSSLPATTTRTIWTGQRCCRS